MLRDIERNSVRWGGGVGNFQTDLQEKLGARYIAAIGKSGVARRI